MLAFPFKKTDELDIASPFKRFLQQELTEQAGKYESDIDNLRNMRREMGRALTATDANREVIKRYYVELCHAEPFFPISDSEIRAHFSWSDAFKATRKSAMNSYAFEKAGVLYNLAALETFIGSCLDRTTPDGLREASQRFKIAAGIYQHIRDELIPQVKGVVTSDLSNQGLNMAILVMQAQAQACIFELSVLNRSQSNMKPGTLAKLAQQVSDYFSRATTACRSADLAGTLDSSWQHHVSFQTSFFTAKAEYWQAMAVKEMAEKTASGYGEQIRRLMVAEENVGNLLSTSNRVSFKLTEQAQDLRARAARQRELAQADNESIYHEAVPRANALKPIGKVSLVEGGAVLPPLDPSDAVLFLGMLPAGAVKLATSYLADLGVKLKETEATVKTSDKEARDKLAEVGLPGSIEASQTEAGIPDSLWVKVEQAKNGMDILKSKAGDNERSAARAQQILDQVQGSIEDEQRVDSDFRARNAGYEGTTSEMLCRDLSTDYGQYLGLLEQAQQSNATLASKMEDSSFQGFIQLLSLNRNEISALLPSRDSAAAPLNFDLTQLSGLLTKLAELIAERNSKLENLKEMTEREKEDIVQKLSQVPQKKYEKIISQETKKFEALKREINKNIGAQPKALKGILSANSKFMAAKATDEVTLQREEFLQEINKNLGVYLELVGQSNEGSMFFIDLLRRVAQLFQTAQDMCYTQQMQRSEYETTMRQLQQDQELAQKLHNEANITPSAPPVSAAPAQTAYPTMDAPPPSYAQLNGAGSVQAYSPANPFNTAPQTPSDPKVARLCELGFSMSSAEAALKKHNGDENAAANELFST